MSQPNILLTGATGFIGGQLLDTLRDEGGLRALVRDASKLNEPTVEVVEGDLSDGDSVSTALGGIEFAYYLVHSMEPGDGDDFAAQDRRMAQTFLDAAEAAGVRRLIYLGGVKPDGEASDHLRSRLEVEEILGSGSPEFVSLRASMIVGARSDSFATLAQIVDRLPVLALPSWGDNRTQPIAVADIVAALSAARTVQPGNYTVGGPDEVTIEEMCKIIADELGETRKTLRIPVSSPKLESVFAAAVSDSERAVLEPLLEGMSDDLAIDHNSLEEVFGITPTAFRTATADAVADMRRQTDS